MLRQPGGQSFGGAGSLDAGGDGLAEGAASASSGPQFPFLVAFLNPLLGGLAVKQPMLNIKPSNQCYGTSCHYRISQTCIRQFDANRSANSDHNEFTFTATAPTSLPTSMGIVIEQVAKCGCTQWH